MDKTMKVAIASDNKKAISHHFGRALGFVVFNIKDGKAVSSEYRENIGKSNGECNSCDHQAMIANVKDCEVVISHGMGQRIYADLVESSITPIVTDEDKVEKALEHFLKDELENRTDRLH